LLSRHESEKENIPARAVVALDDRVLQRGLWMQGYFLMSRFDHMQYNMASILAKVFGITEPFVAVLSSTFHYTFRLVNATVRTSV